MILMRRGALLVGWLALVGFEWDRVVEVRVVDATARERWLRMLSPRIPRADRALPF